MWNRVLLLSLAFSLVRTSSLPKPSLGSKSKASRKSLILEEFNYVDEALKSVSREVKEFSFSEDDDASWFIEPTSSLSPSSTRSASQMSSDVSNPKKRAKTEYSYVSSVRACNSFSAPITSAKLSPEISTITTHVPNFVSFYSSAASLPEHSSLNTIASTLKAPPKPNLLELDLTVDVPVIESWLLYKYRLVSGDHLATAVDYGRLHIRGWPFQVPIIRSKWNILQVMYLKEAVVGEVEFEFTGKSTIDLEKNSRLEMKLKLALNVPESEPLDWNTVRPYMRGFLTGTDSTHWNEQDRMRVLDIINAVNRMRNVLKKKASNSQEQEEK